jgi:hypothetical protein
VDKLDLTLLAGKANRKHWWFVIKLNMQQHEGWQSGSNGRATCLVNVRLESKFQYHKKKKTKNLTHDRGSLSSLGIWLNDGALEGSNGFNS